MSEFMFHFCYLEMLKVRNEFSTYSFFLSHEALNIFTNIFYKIFYKNYFCQIIMQMSCLTGLKNPFTSVEMFSLPGPSLFLHWGGGIQLGVSMRKNQNQISLSIVVKSVHTLEIKHTARLTSYPSMSFKCKS